MALWILSGTTQVSRYQKSKTKTSVDFLEQATVIGSGISWALVSIKHYQQSTFHKMAVKRFHFNLTRSSMELNNDDGTKQITSTMQTSGSWQSPSTGTFETLSTHSCIASVMCGTTTNNHTHHNKLINTKKWKIVQSNKSIFKSAEWHAQ